MTSSRLIPFLLGAVAMASAIISLFFARYYRTTRDPLFLCFACAFLLEAANRSFIAFEATPSEASPVFYLLRALSYAIIVAGILWKNR